MAEDKSPTVLPWSKKRSSDKESIASILHNFKRHKAEKEQKSWSWARKELQASQLDVGQRIYVRYQVQQIIENFPSDEESGTESRTSEPPPPSDDVKVIGSQLFWWPANIVQPESSTFETISERWDSLNSLAETPINEEIKAEFDKIIESHPDLPVWEIQYEAHDTFASEKLPVVFLENRRLFHPIITQLHSGPYRITQESEGADENGDDDEAEELWDMDKLCGLFADPESEPVGSVEEAQQAALVGGRLRNLLRSFMTQVAQEETGIVTADHVRSFFSGYSDDNLKSTTASTKDTIFVAGSLNDVPFPRASSDTKDQWTTEDPAGAEEEE